MGDTVFLVYAASDRHRVKSAIAQLGVGMADSLESEFRPGDDVRTVIRVLFSRLTKLWCFGLKRSDFAGWVGMADTLKNKAFKFA